MAHRVYLANPATERQDYTIRGSAVDDLGNALGSDRLASLKISIYRLSDLGPAGGINGVENIGILNSGRGNVTTAGTVTIKLTADDNQLVDTAAEEEAHVILLRWTWNDTFNSQLVVRSGGIELVLMVHNATKVP